MREAFLNAEKQREQSYREGIVPQSIPLCPSVLLCLSAFESSFPPSLQRYSK